jgi:hypothetical protein
MHSSLNAFEIVFSAGINEGQPSGWSGNVYNGKKLNTIVAICLPGMKLAVIETAMILIVRDTAAIAAL